MSTLSGSDILFVAWAFLFQLALIVHFAVRRWRFALIVRYGWLTYTLGVPAALVSLVMVSSGQPWWMWLGGFICLAWAIYGYTVEFVRHVEWRSPVRWSVFGPYITLYLATIMLYWWPLARISRPLWYAYAVLFVISTVLNVTSHRVSPDQ